MLTVGGGNRKDYFQWIVLGEIGDRGVHVQGLVDQAPRHVQGQKMDHIMVAVNAQDCQQTQHHATQIAAQVHSFTHLFIF